jgi:amino acid permease
MMDFIKKNMAIVIGILVVFVGLVVYLNFFAGVSGEALLATSEADSPISKELLVTLSSLHTLTLDTSIFANPVFNSLTNFGVELPPENVGRRNPFLPAGVN